jgi:DNA-binding transcriptional ArsR family regulator
VTPNDRQDPAVRHAKALSHPLRHRILYALSRGSASPSELGRALGEPVNLVAYHVGVLLTNRLIEPDAEAGGRHVRYRAIAPRSIGDTMWAGLPHSDRRKLALLTIGDVMTDAQVAAAAGFLDRHDVHISRIPLELDGPARARVDALLVRLVEDCLAIQKESDARRATDVEARRSTLAVLNFDAPDIRPA